jgi:putative FmdB family regulatory protein
MPIYDYRCRDCGRRFEYLLRSSSPEAECPACASRDLEQLVSLCSMSSDSTRESNLTAAHKKASGVRKEKQVDEHRRLHDHFD